LFLTFTNGKFSQSGRCAEGRDSLYGDHIKSEKLFA